MLIKNVYEMIGRLNSYMKKNYDSINIKVNRETEEIDFSGSIHILSCTGDEYILLKKTHITALKYDVMLMGQLPSDNLSIVISGTEERLKCWIDEILKDTKKKGLD